MKVTRILRIRVYLLCNYYYLQYYSTKLTKVISTFLLFTKLLITRLVKGMVFINYAFGDRNSLILLSILPGTI